MICSFLEKQVEIVENGLDGRNKTNFVMNMAMNLQVLYFVKLNYNSSNEFHKEHYSTKHLQPANRKRAGRFTSSSRRGYGHSEHKKVPSNLYCFFLIIIMNVT
jgi:hypothetical protein